MDKIKRWRQLNIADTFTGFAYLYLIYSIGDIVYRHVAVMNANSHLNVFQMFRWNSFLSEVANDGFKVLVLFGISAILRRLIKN